MPAPILPPPKPPSQEALAALYAGAGRSLPAARPRPAGVSKPEELPAVAPGASYL